MCYLHDCYCQYDYDLYTIRLLLLLLYVCYYYNLLHCTTTATPDNAATTAPCCEDWFLPPTVPGWFVSYFQFETLREALGSRSR